MSIKVTSCKVKRFMAGSLGGEVDLGFQQPASVATQEEMKVTAQGLVTSFNVSAAQQSSGNMSVMADRMTVSGTNCLKGGISYKWIASVLRVIIHLRQWQNLKMLLIKYQACRHDWYCDCSVDMTGIVIVLYIYAFFVSKKGRAY